MLPLRIIHLGPLRLTPYGASACVGVLAGMAVGGRAAWRAGLSRESAWDAGWFAVVSCFIASRALLVAGDPRAFLRYPMLVLGLPSLTWAGMGAASLLVWLYLRWKRLPVRRVLDAFAPGGAVLATFLEAGHWLEGTEPGMPIFQAARDHAVRLLPVSLYGVFLAALLAAVLWIQLQRGLRAGQVAGFALMAGGLVAYGLDMISLPLEIGSALPLEPGQFVALVSCLAGALLWTFPGSRPAKDCQSLILK